MPKLIAAEGCDAIANPEAVFVSVMERGFADVDAALAGTPYV